MYTFRLFGAVHGAVVVASAVVVAALVVVGRRWRGTPRGRALDRGLAVACLLAWVFANVYWVLPGNFHRGVSFPLHVTDVVGLAGPVTLWVDARRAGSGFRRLARVILYFWGFALTTQAFFTPDMDSTHGVATVPFWTFWLGHLAIIAAAVYDVAVRGYRPTWRDYGLAVAAAVVFFGVLIPFNAALGVNYGFVGPSQPKQRTLINALGLWPRRLLIILPLGAVALALPMAVWEFVTRARNYALPRPAAAEREQPAQAE